METNNETCDWQEVTSAWMAIGGLTVASLCIFALSPGAYILIMVAIGLIALLASNDCLDNLIGLQAICGVSRLLGVLLAALAGSIE